MLPRSGGDKVYLEYVYRRPRFLAATLIGIHSVLLGFTASNCIVFAEYVLFARGGEGTQLEMRMLAGGLLTSIVVMHSIFLRTGILIQNTLGWLKIGLVVFMVFTGVFVVFLRPRDADALSLPAHSAGVWEGSNWNWGIISTAFFKVWYSYNGLQVRRLLSLPYVSTLADLLFTIEHQQRPQRSQESSEDAQIRGVDSSTHIMHSVSFDQRGLLPGCPSRRDLPIRRAHCSTLLPTGFRGTGRTSYPTSRCRALCRRQCHGHDFQPCKTICLHPLSNESN